ncbi:MAG: alkaline phosphatase family protein [Bacteroidetes bacterium]|nr:alkaline phosphatase family protein [Bacteroidota bacterium]
MKPAIICILFFHAFFTSISQTKSKTENIIIITVDGFRWQEIFSGADPAIISNTGFVKDTSLMRQLYMDPDASVRRKKLMPFFWNVIAEKGQLYGNRLFNNKVNVKNLYKVSYPGYNEILTGYTDPRIVINLPRNNNNINILEYLNNQKQFHEKVVVFSSWNIFPFILNEERSGLKINSGYEEIEGEEADTAFQKINIVQGNVTEKSHTRYDWLTYLSAREYIEQHHPRVVFLGLGETDEFAHHGQYDNYLQQATAIDKMIADLWYYIQTNSFYKDKTTLIITTDHGRGAKPTSWSAHHLFVRGSSQTWLAMMGPDIFPLGEIKNEQQIYQKQIAPTIAMFLGQKFETSHRTDNPISLPNTSATTSFELAGTK